MKALLFSVSVALAMAVPSLASAYDSKELDCQKGAGKCSTSWTIYKEDPGQEVTVRCIDNGKLHKGYVSTPDPMVQCQYLSSTNSSSLFICNQSNDKVHYEIKAHLECQ